MKNGLKRFYIKNLGDLEVLLMNNKVYAGEIAANVSQRTRAAIINRAKELNVSLTNGKAKIATEEAPAAQ
jgi:large subunit ribosomal protein L32e